MKKWFNFAANICAIVLMGIMLIGAASLVGMYDSLADEGLIDTSSAAFLKRVVVALIVFCIGTIIVSALTLARGNKEKGIGLKITMIILIGIIAMLEFSGSGYVYGILCLVPIGLEIASLCVKDKADSSVTESDETVNGQTGNTQSLEEKIAELKHLNEIKAISEEQYNEAVQSLVDGLKE